MQQPGNLTLIAETTRVGLLQQQGVLDVQAHRRNSRLGHSEASAVEP